MNTRVKSQGGVGIERKTQHSSSEDFQNIIPYPLYRQSVSFKRHLNVKKKSTGIKVW